MKLSYVVQKGFRFELGASVVSKMKKHAQHKFDSVEAGGIMLGRFILGSLDVVVDEITTPMQGDKQTRFSYIRAHKLHQAVINRLWHSSNGTCNYLGEWHTHPEALPKPSHQDRVNWRRKLKRDSFDNDSLYFVVVGIKEIDVWRGDRYSLNIERLRLYEK